MGAESRPGEQRPIAARAGARRRPEQRGLRILAAPGAPQRVPVLAQHHQINRHRATGDFDGPAQMGGRFVEGGPGCRFPGRLDQRGDRAIAVTKRPGHAAVVGDLRRGRRHAGVLLQQPGHGEVKRRPPGRRQPVVEDIAEQVMAEPEVAGFVLLQDRGADGTVGERHRRLGWCARDGGGHRDRETSPHDRRHGEQIHDRAGQPGEAAGQHVAHRGRYAGHQGPVEGHALRGEQPCDLLREERVARGTVVHGLDQRRLRALATNLLDQLPDLVSGQPAEPYQLGLPGQLGQERAGWMIADHHLHVAIRADDQRGGVMQLAGEEHEQPQRRHVRPVQVVDDDHQRPLRRPPPQVSRRHVIGTEADRGLIAQDAAAPLPGDAGKFGPHTLARVAAFRRQRTHHLDPRPEAGRAIALPAGAPHDRGSARLGVGHRFGSERGLAHACLTREQDDPARTPDGGVDRRTQRADRQPPPDKHVPRHTPILTLKMGNSPDDLPGRPDEDGQGGLAPVLRSGLCQRMSVSSACANCGIKDGIPRRSLASWKSGPRRQASWSAPRPLWRRGRTRPARFRSQILFRLPRRSGRSAHRAGP